MLSFDQRHDIWSYFRAGESSEQIAQRIGCSIQTVNKYIKQYVEAQNILANSTDEDEIRQATALIHDDPHLDTSTRKARKLTDEVLDFVDKILEEEARKEMQLGHLKSKMKIDAKTIHKKLVEDGKFDISYPTVARLWRKIKNSKNPRTYIKQLYGYGKRAEFDFGENYVMIAGVKTKVYTGVAVLPGSGYRHLAVFLKANRDAMFKTLMGLFENAGGVPEDLFMDNSRVYINKFVCEGKKTIKVINREVRAFCDHYAINPQFTNFYAGNEKGTVEACVRWGTRDLFADKYEFDSWEELQKRVDKINYEYNKDKPIEEERKVLHKVNAPYDPALPSIHTVSKVGLIQVHSNYYSVPASLVGEKVLVKTDSRKVDVYYKNQLQCSWPRDYGKGQYHVDINHFLKILSKKPGALSGSAILESNLELKAIFEEFYEDDPKTFILRYQENCNRMETKELLEFLKPQNYTGGIYNTQEKNSKEELKASSKQESFNLNIQKNADRAADLFIGGKGVKED